MIVPNNDFNELLFKGINDKVSELQLQINEKTEKLHQLSKNVKTIEDEKLQYDIMLNSFLYFKEHFNDLSLEDKRRIIRLLIDHCEWDGENLHIFLYGE